MENKLKSMLSKPNKYDIALIYILIMCTIGLFDNIFTFLIVLMVYTLIILIIIYCYKRTSKKFLRSIPLEMMEKIERGLEHPLGYSANRYVLIENYIILLVYPYKILRYEDILLICYRYERMDMRRLEFRKYCYMVTKERSYGVLISSSVAELDYDPKQFHDVIVRKNPNILVGLTKENKEKLKELYGIDMKKRPHKI